MPVYLKDVLPVDLLLKHIEDGVVRKQVHPQYPDQLYILNYSEVAQFDRIWDDVTKVCRGLIVAATPKGDVVVARGFNKFFNLNTEYVPESMEVNLPQDVPPLATEKLDGSMGLIYWWDGAWRVATRGSFASDQAKWATEFLQSHIERNRAGHWTEKPEHTLVTEIIYAENRIVVDYTFEGLVVTGCINNLTGHEVDRAFLEEISADNQFPVVKKFDKTLAECAAENNLNEEGYVLTFSNGVKVKVKFADYVRLHRILTGLNPKAIWEMLEAGQNEAIDAILTDATMPVAFKAWFGGWVEQLRSRYAALEGKAVDVFCCRPFKGQWHSPASKEALAMVRKATALYFQKTPELCSILFAMLDGKNYTPIIWDRLKPKASDTFKKDGE